jgi:hypothetical protein
MDGHLELERRKTGATWTWPELHVPGSSSYIPTEVPLARLKLMLGRGPREAFSDEIVSSLHPR